MLDAMSPCAALIIWNIIVMLLYGLDKIKARSGAWRIPEKLLITLALCMGALGALAGMRIFRHKLKKPLFSIGVPVCLLLNAVFMYIFFKRGV